MGLPARASQARLRAQISQICHHRRWRWRTSVGAQNGGSARVLPGRPPSLTV